jgi:hypothetical protein
MISLVVQGICMLGMYLIGKTLDREREKEEERKREQEKPRYDDVRI